MAYNTPSPQRAARATTAALANKAGVSGEIIFDTDKNTLVGMDGATNGGHPMALESRKIKSATTGLTINGGTEASLSADITVSAQAIQNSVTELAAAQTACCSKVDGLVSDVEALKNSAGGNVVGAPSFTIPNLVQGETVPLALSAASLLVSGSIARFHVVIPALGVDTTVAASSNAATYNMALGSLAVGTTVEVSVTAIDSLGNKSDTVTKSGTVQAKTVKTPTITSVTGQTDIWASGLTVNTSAFAMQTGTDTFGKATVKIKSGANVVATKDFTSGTAYTFTAAELANVWAGGTYTVEVTHASAGGITSPAASRSVTITGASIATPSLTSPTANAAIDQSGSLIMTSSAFRKSPANAPVTHRYSDWKLTTDASGNNVALSALNSTDLTSHTFTNLSALKADTTYYCWVRHHGRLA